MAEILTLDFARDLIVHVFGYYNIVCDVEDPVVENQIKFIRYTKYHGRKVTRFLKTKGLAVMALLARHLYTESMDEEKFTWCSLKVLDIFTAGPRSADNFLNCCSLLAVIAAYSVKHGGYLYAGRDAVFFILYVTPYYQMSHELYLSAFYKDTSARTIF